MAEGPGISALVACVDQGGRVLIVKQTAGPFVGAWLLRGGQVEQIERVEDAARRELFEETGYRVADLRAAALYEVRSASTDRFHFLVFVFRGGELAGMPRSEPEGELRWVDPREIDPHPNLALALVDLGMIERDRAALFRDLAKIGVEMRRLF